MKQLVLIGGGHSHVAVLKRIGMAPMPDVRVTLIAREVTTPYAGMLPGHIAGHYTFAECHIDLRPLCRFAGARLIRTEAIGLDPLARRVKCRARPPMPYDVVSIDIGSSPATADVPGAAEHAIPVKPISRFVAHWNTLKDRIAGGAHRIAVVGGGAGGVELVLAMRHALRDVSGASFRLLTADDRILPSYPARLRGIFERTLRQRSIELLTGHRVQRVEAHTLHCANGAAVEADDILWATEAGAAAWPREAGLAVDDRGFVQVNDRLQSVSHADVFAAGDIAAVINHPRPKAGVFAVRQGPTLAENLRRVLAGQSAQPFQPQQAFLSLISTGDKNAVGAKWNFTVQGRSVWRFKDWIDRRWMRKYQDLPEMGASSGEHGGLAGGAMRAANDMRCGGCGAKIGAATLQRMLAGIKPVARADVLIGLDAPDDAAVVAVPPGTVAIHTVDYFRAIVDDPYLLGKIAANHALGDIYAMGAEPQSALAIVSVPHGSEADIAPLMQGANEVFTAAHTALVGGHTAEGAELAVGFAVNGIAVVGRLLRKSGMAAGDALILTKPLGTGTLFAADMRGKADVRAVDAAIDVMLQSNRDAAAILLKHRADAATDVTGFGLIGHLMEMLLASGVGAELDLGAVPLLPGAADTASAGHLSTLHPENVRAMDRVQDAARFMRDARFLLLFDPQTAGGFLAAVPGERADQCRADLVAAGYGASAIIGRVVERADAAKPITIRASS